MRKTILAIAVPVLLAGGGTAYAAASSSSAPECSYIEFLNPDGSHLWVEGCGTGPQGETPFNPAVMGRQPVQVDGSFLRSDGCGKTRLTACVVLWGASPRS